ncbi:glycosyltransferase family 2 protein [Planktosalinus lacus]|uniref:Glycosyltransferase 2-like domain-containing protein n=1 Tax=Planktosalinus lacus TaxID=1526573 RepID=A0A8J2Y5F1_9FLAO|nr:glycosyltransferase family 2 protein [Planktosalinus lacus]GGD84843.1 hypothetical protein GCM10011312_06090 [Planktosalinus lacus]
MIFNPLISVIVPCYNHKNFINKRIDSILYQTYQNFEIIILDDASSDKSDLVLKSYKQNEKVKEIIVNKTNSGSPFGLWQRGFNLATGDYIWIAESDDWADKAFLESLVLAMHQHDKIVLAHCNSIFETETKSFHNTWWDSLSKSKWEQSFVEEGAVLLKNFGKYKCPVINVSSAIFKKELLVDIEIPTQYRYCGDWWFWAQVFKQGKVAYVAKHYNHIRIHKTSATATKAIKTYNRFLENVKVINQIHMLLDSKLTYDTKYNWLLDIWLSFMKNNRNYLELKYYKNQLPLTFKIVFLIKLLRVISWQLLKKIRG